MRRFWEKVTVEPIGARHAVRLDGRAVNTPTRAELYLPNSALAAAVKAEWDAAGEKIDPAAMPMTGFANAAIDRVAKERAAFVAAIGAYAETDLFCYRAEAPAALSQRQEAAWGGWLRWAQARYLIRFHITAGIMHQPQPAATIARLREAVAALSDWQLAAASKLTALSGSLIALLALAEGAANAQRIWPDLIVDELWQEEQWGADDYARKNRHDREADFYSAARFLALVSG